MKVVWMMTDDPSGKNIKPADYASSLSALCGRGLDLCGRIIARAGALKAASRVFGTDSTKKGKGNAANTSNVGKNTTGGSAGCDLVSSLKESVEKILEMQLRVSNSSVKQDANSSENDAASQPGAGQRQ
jgi:hypothetical protein